MQLILLYYVPLYGSLLILWGYLNLRQTEKLTDIGAFRKFLSKMSSWLGILGGFSTIIGIMHTMIVNLGRSVAIHEFNHQSTWLVLAIGALVGLISFLYYLKTKKLWPELLIAILSGIEVFVCLMIIGYFSR